MLYGRYQHNIDAKGRIFVPAKLREKLGDSFIAAAVMDRCVSLYSMEEWDKLLEGISGTPMTQARKLLRYLSANAADVQVDAQGRILLPKHLLAYASLEKEALVLGAGNRAEIWNPEQYEENVGDMTSEAVEAEFMKLGLLIGGAPKERRRRHGGGNRTALSFAGAARSDAGCAGCPGPMGLPRRHGRRRRALLCHRLPADNRPPHRP